MRRIYIRKRALYTWQKEPYTSEAMENETHIHGQKSLKRMSKRDWYRLQKEPYTWEAPGVRYALQPTREWNLPSSETYIHDQKSPILTTKGALHPILGKPMATDTHCNRHGDRYALQPTRQKNAPSSETHIHDQKSPMKMTTGALYPIPGKPLATDTHYNRQEREIHLRVRPIYMAKRANVNSQSSPVPYTWEAPGDRYALQPTRQKICLRVRPI